MDIEQIEKTVTEWLAELKKEDGTPVVFLAPAVQCQLLLHIYHKLEAIEEQGQTAPGKW